jgi:hypothetical protein
MKFQFYLSTSFSKYLPLILYRDSLLNIIHKNITKDIYLIDNSNDIITDNSTTLIVYSLDLSNIINTLCDNNITTFIVNTEHYRHFNIINILNIINNRSNFYLFEYNPINISNISKEYSTIQIRYLPLLYHEYLTEYYDDIVINKKELKEKEYDILFYGSINDRRYKILEKLSTKYKVIIVNGNGKSDESNKQLMLLIENSKIVLNIYYYEYNFVFDYYRLAFLIANNAFIINEYPRDVDLSIQNDLIDFDKHIISVNYDNIIETVDKYMDIYNNNEEEIIQIKENQLEWFKKNKMEDYFMKINNFA